MMMMMMTTTTTATMATMMMMMNFYDAISQWYNDALQEFVKIRYKNSRKVKIKNNPNQVLSLDLKVETDTHVRNSN